MATTFMLPGTDRKGSVLISNHAAELGRNYTAFGFYPAVARQSATTAYAGQVLEPDIAGYALGRGTRIYDPRLMRLQSYDLLSPFGEGGLNGYAYCLGDPVNRSDPSGRLSLFDIIEIGGAGAAVPGLAAAIFTGGASLIGTALAFTVSTGVATAGSRLIKNETVSNVFSGIAGVFGGATLITGGGGLLYKYGGKAVSRVARALKPRVIPKQFIHRDSITLAVSPSNPKAGGIMSKNAKELIAFRRG